VPRTCREFGNMAFVRKCRLLGLCSRRLAHVARTKHQTASSLFTPDFVQQYHPWGVSARFSSSAHEYGFDSTIFALSSGHGKCGVAVVRVTGPHASSAVRLLTRRPVLPAVRRAALKRLYDSTGEPLDRGLVIWFPGTYERLLLLLSL